MSNRFVGKFLRNDPIGRFLSNEQKGLLSQMAPYGFYTDLNLYTYCLNNPLNYIDPYGLITVREIGDYVWNIFDLITDSAVGAGTGALTGQATVSSYTTAINSMIEDPWFAGTPGYEALSGIAGIPASTGIDPILPPDYGGGSGSGGSGSGGSGPGGTITVFIHIPPFIPHPEGYDFISIDIVL